MKISYITQATGNIEVLSEIETAPKKLGTVGEHLAYAISTTLKFAKKARATNLPDADLNRELKNTFASCMNEASATSVMMSSLPEDFNFTVNNLAAKLAEIFVVNDVTSNFVVDQRIELHIPECPIYLTPITYGIKLNNDPNWYDIDAIYRNTCLYDQQSSPMTNNNWNKVEEFKKFKMADEELDLMALYELKEIKRYFQIRQQIFRGISLDNSGQYAFFHRPSVSQHNSTLTRRSNPLNDRLDVFTQLVSLIEILNKIKFKIGTIRNDSEAQSFRAILPALFITILEKLKLLVKGFESSQISNDVLQQIMAPISTLRAHVNRFAQNKIAEPEEEVQYSRNGFR